MTLPNFLIIGAQKAGTTWLAHMLQQHPDVYLYPQEIHFFDHGPHFEKGVQWYADHFRVAGNVKAIGEKTPEYFWVHDKPLKIHIPHVHQRIKEALPEIKLIAILRDPVKRTVSNAKHLLRQGLVSPWRSIDDILLNFESELEKRHGLFGKGVYIHHLKAYEQLFPREQMLILIFEEDVVCHPNNCLERICRFLNIDDSFAFRGLDRRIHEGKANRLEIVLNQYFPFAKSLNRSISDLFPLGTLQPGPDTLNEMARRYADANQELFDWLGKVIEVWTKP